MASRAHGAEDEQGRRRHTAPFAPVIALVGVLVLAVLCVALLPASRPALAEAESAAGEAVGDAGALQPVRAVVDPFESGDGYSTVLYNNPNGLPTSEANAIAETSEGFIWIGSYSGLIRYDGNTFERIDSTTGIASVVSLFVDSHDRLWVGTNDSGVAVMEQGEFTFFTKADGLGSASVRAVAEDASGNIYVATTKGIAIINEQREVRALSDANVSGSYVSALRTGPGGLLYGITREGAVFTLDEGRVIAYYSPAELGVDGIVSILPDPESPGDLYLGTAGSEVYHGRLGNLAGAEVFDVSPLSHVKSLEFWGGRMWVCADNGIGALDGGELRLLTDIPLDDSIDHSLVDYEGNLWFTSSRQGVMKLVPNQFLDLNDRYNLPSSVVNTTCRWNDLLFLGSDSGLVVLADDGSQHQVPVGSVRTAGGEELASGELTDLLSGVRIRSIVRDDEGNLWLSTYGPYGLMRFDGEEATCFTVADGMPSDRVRTVIERADHSYAAAVTGGVALISGDEVTRVYSERDGIANTEVLTVAEAADGRLVVGSDGDGIYVIDGGDITHVSVEDGLASDVVMRIKRDVSRNVFWIVTSNSIAYMGDDLSVSTVEDFPYPNNFDLYENAQGELWVLSSNGIYVTTADELLENGEVSTVYYGSENGLPHIATANSYSELTEAGELYIAGSTGVARVNIEVPFEGVDDIKMAVPFVEADGTYIYPGEDGTITVPADTHRLTVHPFVYTYSLMNPQVTYQLEGLEEEGETERASELVPIDYTNLRGGSYRFVMQLHDAMGHGNQELAVEIRKELSLTEQPWFRVAAVAAVAALGWAAVVAGVRHRTRRLLKKQEEDALYIREMSEAFARVIDMKDAYTSGHSTRVAVYTEMLTQELGYDEETVERYYNIALLHDIGKIGVPAEILNKPGRLTDEEFEAIKSHTTKGYEALKGISIMPEIAIGAWTHHERPDGKGYPQGLTGKDIPRVGQIIAVADCFDAMYSDRPYRKRMNFDKVVSIIREVRGTQLTEDVVDAFLRLAERGAFRDPDDTGGGTTEEVDNIKKDA